jgi:hypothetical protein
MVINFVDSPKKPFNYRLQALLNLCKTFIYQCVKDEELNTFKVCFINGIKSIPEITTASKEEYINLKKCLTEAVDNCHDIQSFREKIIEAVRDAIFINDYWYQREKERKRRVW